MVIDHIGIVVKSIEVGIKRWETVFGYKQMTQIVINSIQKVRVVFLQKKDSVTIKLVQPIDDKSPVSNFAKKGGGIHHLCFKCDNLDNELERMGKLGIRVLTEPEPGEAFCDEKIAFVYAKEGVNIELIDTELKKGLL
jgi:methylmalonyl-CoA/ethylmalonyl-CoA epimerase